MYSSDFEPDGVNFHYVGTPMRFLNKNGYDHDLERARERFNTEDTYIIEDVDIGNWSSTYMFEGIPGRHNTVMFEKAE